MKHWIRDQIQRAKVERARTLDLAQCGLESFPEEVLDLPDLEVLALGTNHYDPTTDAVVDGDGRGEPNSIADLPASLGRLRSLRSLSLCGNPIADVRALTDLPRLSHLVLSGTAVVDLDPLARLEGLTHLSLGSPLGELGLVLRMLSFFSAHAEAIPDALRGWFRPSEAVDFTPLTRLPGLRRLDVSLAKTCDLSVLANIPALRELVLNGTPVDDLEPLVRLHYLEQLHLGNTRIADLQPLARLSRLSHLSLEYTPITSLAPLAGVASLESLVAGDCHLDSIAPLDGLTNLSHVDIRGFFGDLRPLLGLPRLSSLHVGNTHQVPDFANLAEQPDRRVEFDTKPLAALVSLTKLEIHYVRALDLAGLARLPRLAELRLRECPLGDLDPVRSATGLVRLEASHAEVSDLTAVAELTALAELDVSNNPITDLAPLAALHRLRRLDAADTRIADLAALAELTALEELNVRSTQIESLVPLQGLPRLRSLNVGHTRVSDLSPIAGHSAINCLDIAETLVADLAPLADLQRLAELHLSRCPVDDIDILGDLPLLQRVDAAECKIPVYPRHLFAHPRLHELALGGNPIVDCPPELLGSHSMDSKFKAARAHFADLAQGSVDDRELKLIVLGNGRVGKTSLVRRLLHHTFDPAEPSTHGIRTEAWTFTLDDAPVRLNLWDFGGQDIYFGTHGLFVRSRAVFLVVWDHATERLPRYEEADLRFENRPLSYWLDYIDIVCRGALRLVVENKCDDGRAHPIPTEVGTHPALAVSALTGRGMETLTTMLRDLLRIELSAPRNIGVGRHAIKAVIRRLQDEDERRPPERREHRTLTRTAFIELCRAQGSRISSPDLLLAYLHDTGVVFHRGDLFDDRIVLDQRWALDAVYAIFDRDRTYRQLVRKRGRFRRSDLHDLVWRETLSSADQRLILSMMCSCSICFVVDDLMTDDPEYIAPELLPEFNVLEQDVLRWRRGFAADGLLGYRYEHRFIHQGIMQRFMVHVGRQSRDQALYWRGGLMFEMKQPDALVEVSCRRRTDTDPAEGGIDIVVRGRDRHRVLLLLRDKFAELQGKNLQVRQYVSLDGHEWVDVAKLADAAINGKVVSEARRSIPVDPFRFLLHTSRDGQRFDDVLNTAPFVPTLPPIEPEDPPTVRPHRALENLADLLGSLFTSSSLRIFVEYTDRCVGERLPGASVSHEELAHQAADLLIRGGYVDDHLFSRIRAEFPRRGDEINQVAQSFPSGALSA